MSRPWRAEVGRSADVVVPALGALVQRRVHWLLGTIHGHSARRHDPGCAGQGSRLASAFRNLQAIAQREDGCEQYELFQSLDDPDKVILMERWATRALLEKHTEAERTRNASRVDALVALWAPGTSPTIERFEV